MKNEEARAKNELTFEQASNEIQRLVFEAPGFISCAVLFGHPHKDDHTKALLRPVQMHSSDRSFQVTLTGGRAAEASNFDRPHAMRKLEKLLNVASEVHIATETLDYHLRITRKGRILVSRSKPLQREATEQGHDRAKDYPLKRFDSSALLRALGFADARDALLPSMQGKYRQVNEFLRIMDAVLDERPAKEGQGMELIDIGCGKAYLSLAAQAYIANVRNLPARLTGIDLRSDIIASCCETVERLGLSADTATFTVGDISALDEAPCAPRAPDIVMALHACDSATDEALARGIEWNAPIILCVPCCQHDIQKELKMEGPQRALLRHGILKERIADILADAFRAQILRIMGYRVRVIEFVDPAATGRNVMIRAERGVKPGMREVVSEYEDMKAAWKVTPYLERRLGDALKAML